MTDPTDLAPGYVRTQLQGVDMLRVLDDEVLDRIAERVTVQDHEPGAVVMAEGDEAAGLFVVFRGTATVQRGGVAIALIGPGEHIGEIALLDGRPRLATVRAEEDLRTGFLPSGDFLDVLDASPDVALEMLIAFASRFRALEEQLAQAQAQLAAKDADLP
jgi:CRP-like cAMP-binding protein